MRCKPGRGGLGKEAGRGPSPAPGNTEGPEDVCLGGVPRLPGSQGLGATLGQESPPDLASPFMAVVMTRAHTLSVPTRVAPPYLWLCSLWFP